MNSGNKSKLRQNSIKSAMFTRSALPHHDPPDFKKYNWKRYIPINENILWFKDMYSHEYHVTLKHNCVRGAKGALIILFTGTLFGVYLPLAVYTTLKRYGHKHGQYYNAKSVIMPGHPAYDSNANFPKVVETVRRYKKEYKEDFLGRRNSDFYYMEYPLTIDVDRSSPIEEHYKNYFVKNTKAGGSA